MPHAPMSRRVVSLILSAALVVTGLAVTGVVTTTAASASASSMLGQVNAARADNGLPAYKWNAHLAVVAGEQARRMAMQNSLFHNPHLAGDVANFRRVGENVGYGSSSSAVQKAFMNSPGHRANILRDYTQIGIAQVRDSEGRLWVAQVFRTPTRSASTPKQAKAVKKTAAVKRTAPAKRTTTVEPTAVAAKKAAAVTPRRTSTAPVLTWEAVARLLQVVKLIAAVNGGLAAAAPRS